jgi:hypothetical protein
VVIVVERAFETFQHVDHLREAGRLQRLAGIDRAIAAAADEQHRPRQVALDHPRHLGGELRVDLPIRRLLPGDMLGADRMADVHVLDFGPAIDQHGLRVACRNRGRHWGSRCCIGISEN